MVAHLPVAASGAYVSAQLTPGQALKLIPGFSRSPCRHEILLGGLTNRSFRVESADGTFVLRLDDEHTAGLGLSRDAELKARAAAFEEGLAARVVFADVRQGILLSEYIVGDVWTAEHLKKPENLVVVAELIGAVHALPMLGQRFDANRAAQRYVDNLIDRPGLHRFAESCQQIIRLIPAVEYFRCCHNDVTAGNIVEGEGLTLLDWEYALDNDPMFDLAAVIGYHDLDSAQSEILLDAYTGGSNLRQREHLRNQIRLFDAIQWLWTATRQRLRQDSSLEARMEQLQQRLS